MCGQWCGGVVDPIVFSLAQVPELMHMLCHKVINVTNMQLNFVKPINHFPSVVSLFEIPEYFFRFNLCSFLLLMHQKCTGILTFSLNILEMPNKSPYAATR